MKRILVDYKKLDHAIANLLIETYPDGYGDDDIICFKNAKGEFIEAVELQTEDTLYLVKISKSLSDFIATFEDTIERELEMKEEREQERELELNLEQELEDEVDLD